MKKFLLIILTVFVSACTNEQNITKKPVFSCSGYPDYIIIEKSAKTLTIYDTTDCKIKEYSVRTGLNHGPKHCDGDKKTPEGTYHIKDKRNSKYVRFLEIDYPQQKDVEYAKELGCKPGNAIGIHYYNAEYTNDPSTLEGSLGCITVWNKDEIYEIDSLVRIGTKVIIKE